MTETPVPLVITVGRWKVKTHDTDSPGAGNEITAVVASIFSAITVLLAWLILREAMSWRQWGGIDLIVLEVPVLAAH